jgi:hypothetical protein
VSKKAARAEGRTADEEEVLGRASTAARAALAAIGGRSLLDEMWEEMDSIVRDLMVDWVDGVELPAIGGIGDYDEAMRYGSQMKDWGELRGQAQGVAYCIALVTHSKQRDVDAVRAEAVRRFQAAERAASRRLRTKIAKT